MTESDAPIPDIELTPLRDDLKLLAGPPLDGGSPTWTMHDPTRNKFYRIGRLEFELLARWSRGDKVTLANELVEQVNRETTVIVDLDEVIAMQQFFAVNCLLAPGSESSLMTLKARLERKTNFFVWLIHNYIFFRIPLFKPDAFLENTLPFVRIITTKPFKYLLFFLSVIGLFMVSRQWQSFQHTFAYFFTFQGFIYYSLALVLVKIFHELGHAYTAKHYGVKVPSIGLAFIVLWPLLYSDTTESWKLTDRKARMRIVASGIQVELILALIATLLWSFAPEGPFRSACFIVATATWITSLFMNLSPFMRFDGYYLLSDYFDIPNFQDRAFTLGKWYMRNLILGLQNPCPEILPTNIIRLMIIYAYATWLYRVFLFTTIALAVYHMFFKVLGIFLFSIEIIWFVILPITKELDVWWMHRTQVGFCNKNLLISFSLFGLMLALIFYPWNSHLQSTGLLLPKERQQVFPPFAAQIKEIHVNNNQIVKNGDLLFSLKDPQLDLRIQQADKTIANLQNQLQRQIINSELLTPRQIIKSTITQEMTKLAGLKKQKNRLLITAPLSGTFVDLASNLNPGQWLRENLMLGRVITPDEPIIMGYVTEEMLASIKEGDSGLFYPDNQNRPPLVSVIKKIEAVNQRTLPEPYLASTFGGELATSLSGNQLTTHQSLYKITLDLPAQTSPPRQVIRGRVILKGRPLSLFNRVKNRIIAVLVRESGF